MADTGWKFPGSTVGDRAITDGVSAWADHARITADNDLTTSCTLTFNSGLGLAGTNYDFSVIPAGATIDGIEVRIGDYTAANVITEVLRLILADDSDGSENKNAALAAWSAGGQTDEVGGFSDLWSETITRADVQDVDFGAFIGTAGDFTFSAIDFMQMRVFYTLDAGGSGSRAASGRGIYRGNFRGVI